VTVRNVIAPAPQPEPASRLKSAKRGVSFLRNNSRCRRYMSDLSNVTPRYLGSEQKRRISLLYLTFNSRLASLLLKWNQPQVWRYSLTVAMPLLSTPSTTCQSPSVQCMIARSSAYAYTFWRRWLAQQWIANLLRRTCVVTNLLHTCVAQAQLYVTTKFFRHSMSSIQC